MSNPGDGVKIGEVTRVSDKGGDFYRVTGVTKDGKRGSVEIPTTTLDSMSRKQAEGVMRRGVYGSSRSES